MYYHHDRHFQSYIDNLNKALLPYPALQKFTLTQLLRGNYNLPAEAKTAILHNAGGVYNHALFFDGLSPAKSPEKNHESTGGLAAFIDKKYGSFKNFKDIFNKNALSVFGSGWTALTADERNRLEIVNLKNQETTVPINRRVIILVDVWEHAYYLKHKNLRADYLEDIWNVLDFPAR